MESVQRCTRWPDYPKQWEKLRADPRASRKRPLKRRCVSSPLCRPSSARPPAPPSSAAYNYEEGRKILLFLGAANRDPRQWQNPDDYDIERKVLGHVGFGSGIHVCVGQLLARLEGEVVLQALAKQVSRIELAGEPERRFNNTLRGLKRLPLRLVPA